MTAAPVSLADFEALAAAHLPPDVLGFFAGGAEDEGTLRANRAAFGAIAFLPRVLVDVRGCDTATTVLGQPTALPVLLAPIGLLGLAHPDGEVAAARGAGRAGAVTVLSSVATRPVEDVVAAANGPVWAQLYLPRDRAAARDAVARAEAAGCAAIVLTVDAPVLGRRERDARSGFRVPPGAVAVLPGNAPALADALNPGLTWDDVDWLRDATRLPLVLKGILRADDAVRAVEHGAEAIVVSNHGGRQLDGAVASIRALPAVAAAVEDRAEVYMDGGVRRGVDIVRALALGAHAVLVGRPIVWGLATGGADGVAAVLAMLRDELVTAMRLCGCRTVGAIDPSLLEGVG